MRIFPTVIRKITTVVSGAINWRPTTEPATRTTLVAVLRAALQRPATRQTMAPTRLLIPAKPTTRVSASGSGALAKMLHRPAVRASSFAAAPSIAKSDQRPATRQSFGAITGKILERPASEIVQVTFDLDHKSFLVAVTNDTANTQNWTNPTNAQGANNGTVATWGNPLNILAAGKMHGTTVAQNNRPASLAILAVYLAIWGSWSGLPIVDDLLSGMTFGYRIGGVTALDVQVGRRAVSSGSDVGTEFRIDNGAGAFGDTLATAITWANIALLQFWGGGNAIVGVAPSFSVDAMRLRVVAHETMAN